MDNSLCFSVNKSDVLTRYGVYSQQGDKYRTLAETSSVSLSYPDSCVKVALSPGYIYATSYTLNGENYRYHFFIDNNGQIVNTTAGE